MQSPVLFFAFATFILGVAGQVSSRDDHSDDTAAFGTIHVTFQCDSNGPECKEGAPTPIMLQMIDDAKKETCSKDYVQATLSTIKRVIFEQSVKSNSTTRPIRPKTSDWMAITFTGDLRNLTILRSVLAPEE